MNKLFVINSDFIKLVANDSAVIRLTVITNKIVFANDSFCMNETFTNNFYSPTISSIFFKLPICFIKLLANDTNDSQRFILDRTIHKQFIMSHTYLNKSFMINSDLIKFATNDLAMIRLAVIVNKYCVCE